MSEAQEILERGSQSLHSLFKEYWDFVLETWPTYATYIGDHRYDDKLDDLSLEAYDNWTRGAEEFLDRLRKILRESLTPRDVVNYDLLDRELQQVIDLARFRPNLMTLNQLAGPHIDIFQLIAYHPFNTINDYENYLKRLLAFPNQIEQTITSLREGQRTEIVLARVTVERILAQLKSLLETKPESTDLYRPAQTFPEGFSQGDREQLAERIRKAIEEADIPALRKLLGFLQNEYLQRSHTDIGIWTLPDGEVRYSFLVLSYTTTHLSPEQIHELGKRELEKIRNDMKVVMQKVGFKGDFQEFLSYLRNERKFYHTSAESILSGYKEILKRMESRVSLLFGKLPKTRYELKEIESYRAEASPEAHYFRAPDDGSRPAFFYVNTYKPETRPRYTMEAVAYHEAIPGHHFQLALQQELTDLPEFRRYGGFVWAGYAAFVEGWGLYSEVLPKEVGLYQDPYSEFGRLTADAFRAARLVVDTGIHFYKWTLEQAVSLLEENTALSKQNIVAEVERYIVIPGQALTYKIGQLKIQEIRSETERKLGERFDIRAFHDELLSEGALPLDVLEKKMHDWLSQAAST